MAGPERRELAVPGAMELEDTRDLESRASKKRYTPPWGPILILLAVELCERLTYYTLAGSQKTYLNKQLGFSPSSAASMNAVFSMLCYMWCLPGGLLADSIGRYKVIVACGSIYAAGTVVLAIGSHEDFQLPLKGVFLFGALFMLPLGTGGIKPNICNFGADQIGSETQAQKDTQKKFFSFFYLSINVGVLFAFGYLVNVTTHGAPSLHVSMGAGYFAAYIAAATSMIIALSLFVLGTRFYKLLPGGGIDGFVTMVRSVQYSVGRGGWRAWVALIGWLLLPIFFGLTFMAALQSEPQDAAGPADTHAYVFPNRFEEECGIPGLVSSNATALAASALGAGRRLSGGGGGGGGQVGQILTNVALALGTLSCTCLVVAHMNNRWIKALPKNKATDFTVTEVREGFATVPLIIVVNISMNMAYNAMNTAFPSQACQMNTLMGGTQMNGAFFNLGDALAIIIFTPIFENCLYPFIERLKGSPVRLGQKIIAGLLVSAAANGVSAWMEILRRQAPLMCSEGVSECGPNGVHMRDMSAFWMFVPFALIGAGEILVNPAMYYFAYTASPPKVRSLVQAFNLFFQGSVSNAFTAVAMKATFPNDLDTGNLETYYFVNIICALVGILLYIFCTRCSNHGEDIQEEVREQEVDATEHAYGGGGDRPFDQVESTSEGSGSDPEASNDEVVAGRA